MNKFILYSFILFAAFEIAIQAHANPSKLTVKVHTPISDQQGPGKSFFTSSAFESSSALIYVPPSYDPKKPAPLILALHGSNSDAEIMLGRFKVMADSTGAVILAPDSIRSSWQFEKDIDFINVGLNHIFNQYAIDPHKIAVLGHSDGASVALSLGLANGDLFSHVIAFAPGFIRSDSIPEKENAEKPRIFLSHGVADKVLPIEQASRPISKLLKQKKYAIAYHEFEGDHYWDDVVDSRMDEKAILEWFLPQTAHVSLQEGESILTQFKSLGHSLRILGRALCKFHFK